MNQAEITTLVARANEQRKKNHENKAIDLINRISYDQSALKKLLCPHCGSEDGGNIERVEQLKKSINNARQQLADLKPYEPFTEADIIGSL